MTPWLLIGLVAVIYSVYFWFIQGPWSTKSKHFKLHKILVDSKKAPDFSITVLKGDFPEKTVPCIVTYVPPKIALKLGIKSHQMVGLLKNFKKGFVPENFSAGKTFKDMIHSIAAKEIPESVRMEAKTLGAGEIRLIDDRIRSSNSEADNEHCIGFYKVEKCVVISYSPNPDFRLFSDKGPL